MKTEQTKATFNSKNQKIADFETVVLQVENKGADITGNYETWRNIGFALSNEYGELGRADFHRISQFHPTYKYSECDTQYSNCLKSNGNGISISTFYHHAKQHGCTFSETSLLQDKVASIETIEEPEQKIHTFSQLVEKNLPEFLKKVIEPFDNHQEKDMMLLGAITTLSAGLPNIYGVYDSGTIYANLYMFLVAKASAGKGKLKYCKQLVQPIHDEIKKIGKLMQAEYDMELMQFNQTGKKNSSTPKPEKPPIKMFVIPANNSATGFFQLLNDNDGIGLIFETEADTLANNFKQDYGNYSDGFRNAFHHEQIKYFRRTGNENVEIDYPQVSCVLSGTPKQVLALMPNAENGLFSRFMFYEMPLTLAWKNVFANSNKEGLESYFKNLGKEFHKLYTQLKEGKSIHFTFSQKQKDEFHEIFSNLNSFYLDTNSLDYTASIRRLGIIAFRISMIFTALRIMETGDLSRELQCSDEDFRSALEMIKILAKHSSKVYSSLPIDGTKITYKNNKERLFESLPHKFSTQEAIQLAKSLHIAEKTAEGYLTALTRHGFLTRTSKGNYSNPAKEDTEGTEGLRE